MAVLRILSHNCIPGEDTVVSTSSAVVGVVLKHPVIAFMICLCTDVSLRSCVIVEDFPLSCGRRQMIVV